MTFTLTHPLSMRYGLHKRVRSVSHTMGTLCILSALMNTVEIECHNSSPAYIIPLTHRKDGSYWKKSKRWAAMSSNPWMWSSDGIIGMHLCNYVRIDLGQWYTERANERNYIRQWKWCTKLCAKEAKCGKTFPIHNMWLYPHRWILGIWNPKAIFQLRMWPRPYFRTHVLYL